MVELCIKIWKDTGSNSGDELVRKTPALNGGVKKKKQKKNNLMISIILWNLHYPPGVEKKKKKVSPYWSVL